MTTVVKHLSTIKYQILFFSTELEITSDACEIGSPSTLSVNPANPNYTYEWSTGETSPTISAYPGILYTVTVTDANGCTKFLKTNEIPEFVPTEAQITGPTELCENTSSQLSSLFGNQWSYSWYNSNNGQITSINGPGTYSVTVTNDENWCTAVDEIEINTTPPVPPTFNAPPSVCPNSISPLSIINSSLYTSILWSNGLTTPSIPAEPNTAYKVTVTESNGCTSTADFTVGEYFVLDPVIAMSPYICVGQQTLEAQAVPPAGNIGETTPTIPINQPGDHALTVTDANGCTASTIQSVEPAQVYLLLRRHVAAEPKQLPFRVAHFKLMPGQQEMTPRTFKLHKQVPILSQFPIHKVAQRLLM
ncbi:MAG: hypothetical protein GC192_07145 [Bacteroidetes bacterium]|nr:hypothetical protein [Bacteroidota bacterium]